MDVNAVLRKTRRLFGDTASEIVISQQDIFDWIDEAQMQITRKTHCLTTTDSSAASTYPKTLFADFVLAKRMVYGSTESVIKYIQLDDLDDANVLVPQQVDTPAYYYIANNQFNLFPTKGAADSNTVKLTYVRAPTSIASTATPLDCPLSFHEDIVRYCVMRAHERNENYRAVQMSSDIFEGMSGQRLDEASIKEDENFVIRDDPADWMDYGIMY